MLNTMHHRLHSCWSKIASEAHMCRAAEAMQASNMEAFPTHKSADEGVIVTPAAVDSGKHLATACSSCIALQAK